MEGIRFNDKKALCDTTKIESNAGSTSVTEYHIPGTKKSGIVFLPASEISTSFSPEFVSPAPASTSTTASHKGDKLRPMETEAGGKTVENSTSNEDGGIDDECAPRLLGSDGKGKAMMQKMGWTAGMGLGKGSNGIREPVRLTVNTRGTGLGSSTADANVGDTEMLGNPPFLQIYFRTPYVNILSKQDGVRLGWTPWTPISEPSPASETFDEKTGTLEQNREMGVKECDRERSNMW
jgi:hypothetical protein